jgi:hypothetical protein
MAGGANVRFVPKADFDYREILLRLDLPPSAAANADALATRGSPFP